MKANYIEVIWLRKFLMKLGVVLCAVSLMILFYDKSGQYIIKGTKGPLEMYHSEKKKVLFDVLGWCYYRTYSFWWCLICFEGANGILSGKSP